MRALLVVNPKASTTSARARDVLAHALASELKRDVAETNHRHHTTELAAQAAADGLDLVVALGGDGTVNEVVNGVVGAGAVELAVIPRGTGWDFVRTFDIPRDLDAAIDVALNGAVREIDAGSVGYRTWGGEEAHTHFANVGSAGISGAIARRANESSKALGGKVSYYWATLAVFVGWQTGGVRDADV